MVLSVEMACCDFIRGNEQDYFLTLTSNFLKSPLVAWKQVMEINRVGEILPVCTLQFVY